MTDTYTPSGLSVVNPDDKLENTLKKLAANFKLIDDALLRYGTTYDLFFETFNNSSGYHRTYHNSFRVDNAESKTAQIGHDSTQGAYEALTPTNQSLVLTVVESYAKPFNSFYLVPDCRGREDDFVFEYSIDNGATWVVAMPGTNSIGSNTSRLKIRVLFSTARTKIWSLSVLFDRSSDYATQDDLAAAVTVLNQAIATINARPQPVVKINNQAPDEDGNITINLADGSPVTLRWVSTGQTTFDLTQPLPVEHLSVSINGLLQDSTSYTVSGSNLVFDSQIAAGNVVEARRLGTFLYQGAPIEGFLAPFLAPVYSVINALDDRVDRLEFLTDEPQNVVLSRVNGKLSVVTETVNGASRVTTFTRNASGQVEQIVTVYKGRRKTVTLNRTAGVLTSQNIVEVADV